MIIPGLHHVTAIASNPQTNLDFYVGLLGLRLVKRTVNFDDPATYHFYLGDAVGAPGTILTFFPWPGARRGMRGVGEVAATSFKIPDASTGFWLNRLNDHHVAAELAPERFGEKVIRFADPDGMLVELIASPGGQEPEVGKESSVPSKHALRGLHSVTATLATCDETAKLLTEVFGYQLFEKLDDRIRFVAPGNSAGQIIDLVRAPDLSTGRLGAGTVHHVAFRVADSQQQNDWRERLLTLGYNVSPVKNRIYFHSIYFREFGGLLFEIATDPPGFTHDENVEDLGGSLKLPPWMESGRLAIEKNLPAIILPTV